METVPTLPGAISRKIAESIDSHSPREILRFVGLSFLFGIVVGTIQDEDFIYRLLTWKDGFLTTVTLVYGIGFKWKRIARKARSLLDGFTPESSEDTIEDIPTTELLDWLFRQKSLKVKEATKAFRVPQKRVEALTKELKRVEVLIPGENNASVLNPEFSRQDVASILSDASQAADLQPLFRKTDKGFTSEPSAEEIKSRVFTSKPLSAL